MLRRSILLVALIAILAVLAINVQAAIRKPVYKNKPARTCFGIKFNDKAVCGGHGWCTRNDTCACKYGYTGKDCTTVKTPVQPASTSEVFTCFGKKSTDSMVCGGRGKCVANDKCECGKYSAFDGRTCRATGLAYPKKKSSTDFTCFGKKSTDSMVCGGRGKCVANDKCECGKYSAFDGRTCRATGLGDPYAIKRKAATTINTKTCFGINSKDKAVCGGNGWCLRTDTCLCRRGFGGKDCKTPKKKVSLLKK